MHQSKKNLTRILIAGVLLLNLFILGLLAYTLHASKVRKEEEVSTMVENLALLLDQSVSSSVREIDLALKEIQSRLERDLRRRDRPDTDDTLLAIDFHQDWLAQVAEIRITDESGTPILGYGVTPQTRVSYADRSFFEEHRKHADRGLIASKLLYGRIAGTWIIVFSRRYNNPDGDFVGMVTAAVPAAYFERLLSGLKLGDHGIALMRDLDKTMIARFPPLATQAGEVGSRGGSKELTDIIASGVEAQSFYSARTADGVNRINAYRKLSLMPAFVVVGRGEDDYLAQWRDEVQKGAALAILFLVVTSLVAWLLWRLIEANERANRRSQILLQNASDGIHITDLEGTVIEASDAFCRMLGYDRADVIGMGVAQWEAGLSPEGVRDIIDRVHRSGDLLTFETLHRRSNGEVFPVEVTSFPLQLDDKPVLFHSARDITLRKSSEEEVRKLAFFDPLTGLPNRRLLMERLEHAMASCARQGEHGALLFVDLDNFKSVNDTAGHNQGDLLLQEVATILGKCVRRDDTVARLGGDEFVVMLDGLGREALEAVRHAETVATKILHALHKTFDLGGSEHRASASIGITLFGEHPDERVDEPLKRADLAMYEAKVAGRNTLRFFDPKMQARVSTRAELESALWVGLEKGQFLLQYQPQVQAVGRITGVEALLRWRHPERGMVSPAEFIPLAEENGFILPLGRWVLETACAQLALWARDARMAQLSIAVNVSARQFRQDDFVAEVLDILDRSGANPARLKIELTENSLVTDIESVIAKMGALKARGVGFSLDDFGTGYSSLAYLKRLPLDQIKIDQGFVRDILVDPNDAAIAKMVIVLADSLGLAVIAEGVETEDQRDYLAQQGCLSYQGYYFSRPLVESDLRELIGRWPSPHD
ncbi:bifunctional diguanylate cyclase/phosphodiesterase [Thauera humireducens]|uniref:bifunctional diguanylate cyclase/phosphodiesterase n=1 Tax=Thauera humireducens TaxID=1134435 RepID=UPI0024A9AF4D|nr:EAL domain-containing protein [Thauera humireducens]